MAILWWHWLVLGLLLIVAEMAAPGGFYLIFFGFAAVVIGILASLGLAGPLWLQLLLFSVLSVGSLLLFRSRLMRSASLDSPGPPIDTIVGEIGTVTEEIPAGGVGRVELRGTAWSARNRTDTMLARGVRCRVARVDGLMVIVEPEGWRR